MRIECTESVVVNNIIGSFIKQQPTIEKLGYILRIFKGGSYESIVDAALWKGKF